MEMAGAASRSVPERRVVLATRSACKRDATRPARIASSRPREVVGRAFRWRQIAAELDDVAAAGFKEAAVTGVHLGSYGRDLDPPQTLLTLLHMLDGHRSSLRFRLSSLEPMDCGPSIVDLVARSGRFAPHFHLPLQHAADSVLRAMRRPYTSEYYRRLVSGIRDRMPEAGIGSDIIVGFPGETAQDADANVRYLRTSPLTYLHVFPYSDRPGTTRRHS